MLINGVSMISNEDYFRELMSEIKSSAGAEESFCEEKFTEEMCQFLNEDRKSVV